MTETSSAQPSLSTMRLAELQSLASSMGLKGTSRMRKSELVAAIRQARSSSSTSTPDSHSASKSSPDAGATDDADSSASASSASEDSPEQPRAAASGRSRRRRATAASGAPEERQPAPALDLGLDLPDRSGSSGSDSDSGSNRDEERPARSRWRERAERSETTDGDDRDSYGRSERGERSSRDQFRRGRRRVQASAGAPENQERASREPRTDSPEDHADAKAALMRDLADATGTSVVEPQERSRRGRDGNDDSDGYDDERGGRRRRGRKRGRDRFDRDDRDSGREGRDGSTGRGNRNQPREDEVLLPVAGILDVTDNQHAYLRTSGYLPGPKDVYVSNQLIKDNGLRAGDAVTGWVREGGESSTPHQGGRNNRRQNRVGRVKYNPMVSVETVNGMDAERSKRRPEFAKLTPLYPQEQLRLETTPKAVTPRIIDLVSPIGKGQRGLIVSPPKAGKTIVLQQIANAISVNNPEAHLMVVLVDERPEEVTDMQRTVKGEVIASTFDRPASDHTIVAELAIERAKRLVELGQDVVVLLDSITRLGRAYNLAAPASGRILSGGVDASALYPPKRFFGAARNVENGGSLTILATALVETGSKMDEVIFEEFKGTGNMELRLSRQLADKRIFPAVDVAASGTRREELLIDPAQLKIMWRLRRLFAGLEQQQAIELVLSKLKDTQSNAEFLMVLSKTTPAGTSLADGEDE
ncbi:transcription termination factor Rho [Actinomyces oris]|uniref:Transcription termination factor Rho n=1 Tax=Actinomyces oris TaxID=544580 RepID=A0A1Q8VDQ7_9ACTO|nr:transcription termination factor Rho [Actinomyces oris]OLO46207.1 transcription termination factor Rho [Actinomyces oris]